MSKIEQRLYDEMQITRLANAYSHAVMRLDSVKAAAVYVEDGRLTAFGKPPIVGRPAIEAAFVATFAPIEFIVQTCAAGLIDVDGDTARASWSVTELLGNRDKPGLNMCLGVYEDELVRTPQGWRFSHRVFQPFCKGPVTEPRRYQRSDFVNDYAPWPFTGLLNA